MRRPRHIWLAFAFCLVLALAAMAWLTGMVVYLDQGQRQSQQQARVEEAVRLALWRMDSAVSALIAQENTRPAFTYRSFYPARRDYAHLLEQLADEEELLPSPLLTYRSPYIHLHFQIAGGQFTSPQVPPAALATRAAPYLSDEQLATPRQLLATLEKQLDRQALLAGLLHDPPALRRIYDREAARQVALLSSQQMPSDFEAAAAPASSAQEQAVIPADSPTIAQADQVRLNRLLEQAEKEDVAQTAPAAQPTLEMQQAGNERQQRQVLQQPENSPQQVQQQKSSNEWRQRAGSNLQNLYAQKAAQQPAMPQPATSTRGTLGKEESAADLAPVARGRSPAWSAPLAETGGEITFSREGVVHPVWAGNMLLLARRVAAGNQVLIQGCWLNDQEITFWLQAQVHDLLPEARLLRAEPDGDLTRQLASLPLTLSPGPLPAVPADGQRWPLLLFLGVTWVSVLLAAAAVAAMLFSAVDLSEKRGAFVSAVTHELRTPLTTFRIYTEMLASGMVGNPDKARSYLQTLHQEAQRLSHLVENVLAYAQLEGGRKRAVQAISVSELLQRVQDRLTQRAQQAGLELVVELIGEARHCCVRADPPGVEQVLFNLVDNACKYAADAADKRLEVRAVAQGEQLRLSVTDHGQGLSKEVRRRLFEPFSKSAQAAAVSAPGVGLGLALCRRYAREMGGKLLLQESTAAGTTFVLVLPRA